LDPDGGAAGAALAHHHRSGGPAMHPLGHIRQIDYTVIFARDMAGMRHFYESVMEFPLLRALSERWIEYRVGSTTLALTTHGGRFDDPPPAAGALSLQLAFRVAPELVADCAAALEAKGVTLVAPLTDQPFGHRTIFFRDPDGNVLEIYAEI
jgi:catechol 2,3-dioxygenase-like lactoylglutathione lyase family enzyme